MNGSQQYIYKIMTRSQWQQALSVGTFAGAPIDKHDGYIHFSSGSQVAETAAKHFSGQPDLMLLIVDSNRLSPNTLKWEPSRNDELFPHLYGSLDLNCVVEVFDLPLGDDGLHVFPEGISKKGD